ncbi:MAG: gliding motility protein GldM [Muribaculaceae bacterium]|nr:gliding motility protein GldM [Muribaculaceae bacterium]
MSRKFNRVSPRQRMINLMYLVLTAMLAFNISSDVLDGVLQVDDGLIKTNKALQARNDILFSQIAEAARINPTKSGNALIDATQVVEMSNLLLNTIDSLKLEIARETDGKDADITHIRNRENLGAASEVMLSPTTNSGYSLRQNINEFSARISKFISNRSNTDNIVSTLSTNPIKTSEGVVEWEIAKFNNQPVIAALTQLSKIQSDIMHAESEALTSLLNGIDATDLRVNRTNAFVIPKSQIVMQGGEYCADIVLAAIDSTSQPIIEINRVKLPEGNSVYRSTATKPGKVTYNGLMSVTERDGSIRKLPFTGEYYVIEPTATISASMMNIVYAGIENPISVSVPGVIDSNVEVDVAGGKLSKIGTNWSVYPNKGAEIVTIIVKALLNETTIEVARQEFKVRLLPDPTAFIKFTGGRYYGSPQTIQRKALLDSPELCASIDDGILDVKFDVISFETLFIDSMGNAIPEKSNGAGFSKRQADQISRLKSGSRFFITSIKAKGPDGNVRQLSPFEVYLN